MRLQISVRARLSTRFRDSYHQHAGALPSASQERIPAWLYRSLRGCSALLVPWLGQDFFPSVDAGQFKLHVRAQTGTRIEETARLCDLIENFDPATDSARAISPASSTTSGFPTAASIFPTAIRRRSGRRMPTSWSALRQKTIARPRLRTRPAAQAWREQFPGVTFAFLPADIVSQILNFGLPAPIDVQVIGNNLQANRLFADKLLQQYSLHPWNNRLAHPASASISRISHINVDRTKAGQIGFTQRDVAHNLLISLSGSFQTSPTFWLNPKNGVSYSDRDSDAAISSGFASGSREHTVDRH